ncbi:MAG: PEP-CTERM sorting domain-containing protein [Deltaproteobacteria bacterium]|nr:PEP-CTERM sorting domain-containing protein [Deltaproteobacteria bacterium]
MALQQSLWASLIVKDLVPLSGDSLVTLDDGTGLEWMDMPLTKGLSYMNVKNSSYVTEHHFRFATEAELLQLYENLGMQKEPSSQFLSELYNPIHTLHDALGMTLVASGQNAIYGFIGTESGSIPWYRSIYYDCCGLQGTGFQDYAYYDHIDRSVGYASEGFYMVRGGDPDPIPEPTTMLLLGSGLVGLAGFRRKFKKK